MTRVLSALVCTAIAVALPATATAGPYEGKSPVKVDLPVRNATIGPNGLAVPPPGAPRAVVQIIRAGNRIATRPYKYGGGHGIWQDSGYDCSGSVSYALHGAGLVDVALDSNGVAAFGKAGSGRWVSLMGNPGHAYMVVAGLRFDTSSSNQTGNRWTTQMRSPAGYVVRHPSGL